MGLISERVINMGASDRVGLNLTIAEHSSSDFDMAQAIGWLRHHARLNDLRDEHLPILRRVLDACPVNPSTLSVIASLKEDYVQDRRLLKEFLDQQPSSGPDSKGS